MEYCYHVSAGALDYYLDMFAGSLALQKIIVMWSVLVSFIGTLLEGVHLR